MIEQSKHMQQSRGKGSTSRAADHREGKTGKWITCSITVMDQRGPKRWAAQGRGPAEGTEDICQRRRTGPSAGDARRWPREQAETCGVAMVGDPAAAMSPWVPASLPFFPLFCFPLSIKPGLGRYSSWFPIRSSDFPPAPRFPDLPLISRTHPALDFTQCLCMAPASSSRTPRRTPLDARRGGCLPPRARLNA